MKKRMMAIYTLAGVLAASPIFTSCVENEESVSVSTQRDAKEKERQALAALKLANIEAEKIISEAEIAYQKASKAHEDIMQQIKAEEAAQEKKRFELELEAIKAEQAAKLKQLELEAQENKLEAQQNADSRVYDLYQQIFDLMGHQAYLQSEKIEIQYDYALMKAELFSADELKEFKIKELENSIKVDQMILDSLHKYFDGSIVDYNEFMVNLQSKILELIAENDKLSDEIFKLREEKKKLANVVDEEFDNKGNRFDFESLCFLVEQNPNFKPKEDLYLMHLINFLNKYGQLDDVKQDYGENRTIIWDTQNNATFGIEFNLVENYYDDSEKFIGTYTKYWFEPGTDAVVSAFLKEITSGFNQEIEDYKKELARLKEGKAKLLEKDPEADVSVVDEYILKLENNLKESTEALAYNKTFAADLLDLIAIADTDAESFQKYMAEFAKVDALRLEIENKESRTGLLENLLENLIKLQVDMLELSKDSPENTKMINDIQSFMENLENSILMNKEKLAEYKTSELDMQLELQREEAKIQRIDQLISKVQEMIDQFQKRLASLVDAQ